MAGKQLPLAVGLDDHARFSTFLEGPNGIAVRQLQALPETQVAVTWIWGPPGTGKSHLLQATCAAASEQGLPGAFVPLASWRSLQPGILEQEGALRILCVDDVDLIAGQPDWEQALFRAFNEITQAGGAVLAAASASPQAVAFGLADLKSRLAGGPTYRLQHLSDDQRIAALQLRASHRGLELAADVGEWLLKRVPRDMGSLYALLDTLDLESLAAGRRLTIPFVRQILEQNRLSS